MTRDEIIELAREAGLYVGTNISGVRLVGSAKTDIGLLIHMEVDELARFAALVADREREKAAHAAGEYAKKWWSRHSATNKHMTTTLEAHNDFCALQAAIRARNNT